MKTPNYNLLLLKTLSGIVLFIGIFLASCSDSDSFEESIVENSEDIDDESLPEDETDSDSNDDSDTSDDQDDNDNSNDENSNEDNMEDASDDEQSDCQNPADFVFGEANGIVSVEFESGNFSGEWEEMNNEPNFTGTGYMVWTANQSLGQPGNGLTTFLIDIKNPGTYRFIWNSAVTIGDNGTDHNDTWLRFNDADDFFGQRGNSIVYPKDSGKSPNPNGASKDGWFKIYRSGNDLGFKWQSSTSDNDAHDIYVVFNNPGTYTMEVSARSTGHAINKFVLFDESVYTVAAATADDIELSSVSCD